MCMGDSRCFELFVPLFPPLFARLAKSDAKRWNETYRDDVVVAPSDQREDRDEHLQDHVQDGKPPSSQRRSIISLIKRN
jgi:hypothetical protein